MILALDPDGCGLSVLRGSNRPCPRISFHITSPFDNSIKIARQTS